MREHAELMGQLKESFRNDHDVQGVHQVTTAIAKMSEAFAKRQDKASTAVAALTQRLDNNSSTLHIPDEDEMVEQQIPGLRDELSLYAHISKIKWDTSDPDRIAGIFSDPARGKIEKFSLPNELSRVDQIHYIWKVID
ncbi:hypothetical protein WJX74_002216 [Apatococcus lobatus]|uniref:Kinetochore protein Spc24 n=1 Tax=Apatococcus lobatus TaxID=904363 RepID=A0AAW1R347_9CHLO